MSTEICNRRRTQKFLVSGCADWALGHGSLCNDESSLVAIKTKKRAELSRGEAELITYLAILRENQRQTNKTNIVTQGFYTDGLRYAFICITEHGKVVESVMFDISLEGDLQMVYSFIIAVMETAMKNTPNDTPTKSDRLRDEGIHNFKNEVWSKVFEPNYGIVVVGSDDEMDDPVALS